MSSKVEQFFDALGDFVRANIDRERVLEKGENLSDSHSKVLQVRDKMIQLFEDAVEERAQQLIESHERHLHNTGEW